MEREGTPEDFSRMAAKARGQELPPNEERNEHEITRPTLGRVSPPEPDTEGNEFWSKLLGTKPEHVELVRLLHGTEEPE
jgi:hypothetical protein